MSMGIIGNADWKNINMIKSKPIKICWAGFESDTLKLQNNGWQLAIEDHFSHFLYRHSLRFILRHEEMRIDAITDISEIDFHEFMHWEHTLRMNICVIAKEVMMIQIPAFDLHRIYQVEAMPSYVSIDMQQKIEPLSSLKLFNTIVKPDNALIIEPDRISDILAQIVDAQSPKQAEIRERMKRQELREDYKQTLHAQIISVAA